MHSRMNAVRRTNDTGARRTQPAKDAVGVAVTEINAEGDEQDAHRVREGCQEQLPQSCRRIGSEGQRD